MNCDILCDASVDFQVRVVALWDLIATFLEWCTNHWNPMDLMSYIFVNFVSI